jgi:hypothetical protein
LLYSLLVHRYKEDYYPIAFRGYAPEADGKTKNEHFEHFREMLRQGYDEKSIKADPILFDSG